MSLADYLESLAKTAIEARQAPPTAVPAAAPAPTPVVTTAPTTATPRTVNALVDSWIAKHGAPREASPVPEKSKEELADEAYRARQAASYLTKEEREAAAPAPAPSPAPEGVGNKYAGAHTEGGKEAAPKDINWGGAGVGGTATIAAHEVPLAMPARQAALTGAMDAEGKAVEGQKVAATESADAGAEIEKQRTIGLQDVAKATEDAGVDVKLRAQAHADEAKEHRKHIDDFSAKVAAEKIDPNRMMNNASTGRRITWTLAEAFGAVSQAFLHTPTNQIADRIENLAAQDVAAQRANHEIGRERVSDMNSMYAHALAATGREEEAERLATGYALDAAKQQAQALAQGATSAAQKAKGKEIVAALDEKQATIAARKAEAEIKLNPMVQARTVATGADMSKVYATARQYSEDQAKLGTKVAPDEAIRWAYKMHTGKDPLPGAGAFAGGAKAEAGSKQEKLEEFKTEVEGGIATIDSALKTGAAYKQGPIGAMWSHVPGATDSKSDKFERDKYNAQVKALVGAGWKLTTSGMEPKNPAIIEELSEHFMIQPGEGVELSRKRMKGLQETLRDAGRSKGVLFDEIQRDNKWVPPGFKK